ncbi:hypothetical protein FKM82_024696 [Ascaphus truei]
MHTQSKLQKQDSHTDELKLLKRERSSRVIQKYYKALIQVRLEREKYLCKSSAALTIHAAYRGMKTCRLNRKNKAACLLQSIWRMRRQRENYEHLKQCVILLQTNVRKCLQQRYYK